MTRRADSLMREMRRGTFDSNRAPYDNLLITTVPTLVEQDQLFASGG